MLKKIKIYSVMFLLFALFSCGILNATEYINLNTDSNQIYSTRGVFCETCGHQYPHYFYIINNKTCGYICNKKAPDTMLSHKPHAKGYCSLYVTEKAPLVKLLKSFFDSSNWTTSEEPNQTTSYTVTPTPNNGLTITFINSNDFTLSCGKFKESFRITKHDNKTSASVIFKAFEFYCYAQGKINYFNSDTQNIINYTHEKNTDLNNISLQTSENSSFKLNQIDDDVLPKNQSNTYAADNFAIPSTPMKGRNFVAPSTTSFELARNDFATPLVPTSKRIKKDFGTSLMYTPKKTPGRGLCTPTTYGHGKYYVTPEKKTKDTGKQYFTGGSCGISGIVQNIKRYISDSSNWTKNVTPVGYLLKPIGDIPQGWCINLNELLKGFPEFYNEKVTQNINDLQSKNLPLSSPEQPFLFKRFNGLTLYCFRQGKPNESLKKQAFNYVCKILEIDVPKFEIY